MIYFYVICGFCQVFRSELCGDVIPRSFAVGGRLNHYRNIFKCLGNGYLVFFKNDVWSGNIFFIPFRIDRKVVEDKVFNLYALILINFEWKFRN